VRVIAAFADTSVEVQTEQGTETWTIGDQAFIEFDTTGPFRVSATHPVSVAQYMVGQYDEPTAPTGDPSLTVLVPAAQYRASYDLILPSSYNPRTSGQNYLHLVRSPAIAITLDGTPIDQSFAVVSGVEIGLVPVDGGRHHVESTRPFGVM